MRYSNNGNLLYELASELMDANLTWASETDQYWFVNTEKTYLYDETTWRIDKKNGKVVPIHFVDYILDYSNTAKECTPNAFKQWVNMNDNHIKQGA